MTRPWGQLHASTLTHRKYLKSSHEERSAWLTLLLWSFNNPNDAALGCREDVIATLRTLGGHRHPAAVMDRLIGIGWVDDQDGALCLHDWDEWQPEDPTGAKRKQAQRDREWGARVDSHAPVTGASRDILGPGEERRREENQERRGEPVSGPDCWCELTERFPVLGTDLWKWCVRLEDSFGLSTMWEAMQTEWAADNSKHTLLSRTEARLSRLAARLDAQERDAERAKVAAQRAPVVLQAVKAEPITPEEEERQIAEYKAAHNG